MREADERDADRLLDRALVLTPDEIRGLAYRYREIAVTQTGVLPPLLGGRSMESSESRARAIVGPEWTARIETRAGEAIDRARRDGRVSRLRTALDWTYVSSVARAISAAALAVAAGAQLKETDRAVLQAP